HLVRLSSLIAHELRRQLEPAGATEVQLTGAAGPAITEDGLGSLSDTPWLPLVDWRARTVPPLPDEVFQLSGADPGDPCVLADAAISDRAGKYSVIRTGNLLILPATRAEGRGHGSEPEHGSARFLRV